MRRALLAATLLAIPVLGGFECEVTVEPWSVGDSCTWGSFDDSQCSDGDTLLYCDVDNYVTSRSCSAYCAGGTCVSDIWGYGWCECPDMWTPGAACDYWTEYPGMNLCYDPQTVYMCNADDQVQSWDCATACPSGVTGYCDYDTTQGANWCMCPEWTWAPGYSCDYWTQYNQATCDTTLLTYCAETNVIGSVDCVEQCVSWYGAGAMASCGVQDDTGYNGCVCEIATCTFAPFCNDSAWLVWCDGSAETWTDCDAQCRSEGATKGVCTAGACLCG